MAIDIVIVAFSLIHLLTWAQTFAHDFKQFNFVTTNFKNGEEISRASYPSLIACLAHCGTGCGAVKFFRSSGTCVLFSEVLFLTEDVNVTSDAMYLRKTAGIDNRYLLVHSETGGNSWDQAFTLCGNFGSSLATLRTQQDFDVLAAALNKTRIKEESVDCSAWAWLGGEKKPSENWKWYTGEDIEEPWPFWTPGSPQIPSKACMRLVLGDDRWMEVDEDECANAHTCAFVCE